MNNHKLVKNDKPANESLDLQKVIESFESNEMRLYAEPSEQRRNNFIENMKSIKSR